MLALHWHQVNARRCAALALSFGLAGCGSKESDSGENGGDMPKSETSTTDTAGNIPGETDSDGAQSATSDGEGAPPENTPGAVATVQEPDVIVDGDEEATPSSECARQTYEAERVNTNVYLLLDISGSMLQPVAVDSAVTQWGAVREAVKGFIGAPESSGLTLAMNYYPIQSPRQDCSRRTACPGDVPCIASLCDLRFAVFGDITLCNDDSECGLVFTDEEGTAYGESCVPPAHCSGDPLNMCLIDDQCPAGETCVFEPVAVCPGANSCTASDYALPDVDLAALPAGADGFITSLDAHEPDPFALTPTHVALAGAYSQVQDWIASKPDSQSVMILATDGVPNGCTNDPEAPAGEFESAQTFAELTAAREAGITTFVIGVVPDPTGLDIPEEDLAELQAGFAALADQLDEMAVAGGSEAAFNVSVGDDTTEGFLDALSAIRGAVLPCNYEIPKPESGSVSFDRLNVELTAQDADQGETIPQVPSLGDCVDGESAWYYSKDDAGTPSRVELCPSACDAANAAIGSRIDIVLGCQTIVRVR